MRVSALFLMVRTFACQDWSSSQCKTGSETYAKNKVILLQDAPDPLDEHIDRFLFLILLHHCGIVSRLINLCLGLRYGM